MKKYCIFTDIHGNIDALKKLMETDDFKNADGKIFLGDAVGGNPYFNEVVKALFDNNCIVLLGNHDVRAVFNRYNKRKVGNMDQEPHFSYIRNNLDPVYMAKMKNIPFSYEFTINDKKFYFTHYVWRTKYFISDRIKPITAQNMYNKFKKINADYIFYGHEHKPSYFDVKGKVLVDVGSLGMKCPGNYVMLEIRDDGEVVISRKIIEYDLQKLRSEIRVCNVPQAKEITDEFDYSI